MSDVYLIHASEDFSLTEKIYNLLKKQWNVWWDDKIVGSFRQAITDELPKTKCVVAICSKSTNKDTIGDEIGMAKELNKPIIVVSLDGSSAPYPYRSYSKIDFSSWDGKEDFQGVINLKRKILSVVPERSPPPRPDFICSEKLKNPTIFMSVSSHDTRITPVEAISVLKAVKYPAILISAYDIFYSKKNVQEKIIELLREYRNEGGFVLMDSGNYEAQRKDNKRWKPSNLESVLPLVPHDIAFCFDVLKCSKDVDISVSEIVDAVKRDSLLDSGRVLPIVHVSTDKGGLKRIPQVVRKISEELSPPLIAIPERELGAGMAARVSTMKAIRNELNKLPYYQPIHLLGTGNPWSISVLASAGADTFDGLEWCRYAIDPDKEIIHHFQNFDFFSTEVIDRQVGYVGHVLLSNLKYYMELGSIMQSSFCEQDKLSFIYGVTKLKKDELKERFPEIFP